ncbi:MAG: allantoinase AllB [Nocardiopsaceae bacterium]|nr:allantoinase AllB [Nocardiopsaceae bacterium]
MPPNTLVVRSTRVVTPDGIRRAAVVVAGRRIAGVASYDYRAAGPAADVDLGDLALLPGLVDTHVHVNEPGLAESEGFGTATSAAAAGGITTICDMPLNSVPVTTSLDALRAKLAAARGRCRVDVAFWGGAVPGNLGRLGPLAQAGVAGFKCFLSPTSTTAFPPLGAAALKAAMAEVAATGTPLLVHAEDPRELRPPKDGSYGGFLASRPPVAERRAIEAVVTAAAATGARAHIVHLAAADCAPLIAAAKTAGVNLTVETCPHYLVFAAEDIPDGATEFKCCPPVRSAANREALWRALAEGVIDCVVSDHSPCLPELKRGDFATAWGGIASLQVTLPAVWTAAHSRGFTLTDIARWMSAAPARLAGLSRKGAIAAGRDADLVAFDPDAPLVVDGTRLRHRHPVTPYHGRPLTGVVTRVWLRGREILPGDSPHGSLLFPRVRGLSG